MEVMEAIKGRRSIRKYKQAAVSDEDLQFILEAARWAPSWANTQCFEFIVVRDFELRKRLAETLPEANPARPAFAQVPVVIVACAHKEKAGYFKAAPATDKGDWLMFDTALALQNLTLAAYSRGLGTVHVGFFDTREGKRDFKCSCQRLRLWNCCRWGFLMKKDGRRSAGPLKNSCSLISMVPGAHSGQAPAGF